MGIVTHQWCSRPVSQQTGPNLLRENRVGEGNGSQADAEVGNRSGEGGLGGWGDILHTLRSGHTKTGHFQLGW